MDALLKVFPDLTIAAEHIDEDLLKELGCRPDTIITALETLNNLDIEKEEQLLQKSGARLLNLCEPGYPFLLRDIPDAPPFLYVLGDLSILQRPCVGVVGTRKMSPYGERAASELTRMLAGSGITTVSGLARGIDSVVATETMFCKGVTAAVLGQGLLTVNGRQKELMDQIIQSGGVVLSEFPLENAPDLFTFPRRNRVIAGLSLATVVVEAPEGSGALITAKLAFDYGREVFAIPGSIYDENFAGNNALLALQKAMAADRPARVLEGIGVIPPGADSVPDYLPTSPEEERVYSALTRLPQNVDDLVVKSGLPASSVSAVLTSLELNDVAEKVGVEWVRR
jgi:DNA processing protein